MNDEKLKSIIQSDHSNNLITILLEHGKDKLIEWIDILEKGKFSNFNIHNKNNDNYEVYLANEQLKSGDGIEILWNDGSITNHPLIIEEYPISHESYGKNMYITFKYPCIEINYNGTKLKSKISNCFARKV